MLYEVITKKRSICAASFRERVIHHAVITSYSIHYTKLYDMPDLIQIIVPDEMLFDRVVTDQMDRVLVRQGQQPLADWQPTIFSGEQMSDPEGEGP